VVAEEDLKDLPSRAADRDLGVSSGEDGGASNTNRLPPWWFNCSVR
jgi:hypothetical protein